MRTVLFFISLDRLAFNEHLEGIYRYARKFAWHVQVLDLPTSPSQMKAILALWKPAGAFVEYGDRKTGFSDRAFGGLPVVFLDIGRRKPGRGLYVGLDSAAVGRMGADSLLRLGLSSYGYVSQRLPEQWDLERGDGFADAIGQSGCKVSVFRPATVLSPEKRHRLLLDWLMALPRPCGLMGANDRVGEEVLNACSALDIAVPDDMAVLGVDNDLRICENQTPTLTSINPDVVRVGYAAAELLDRLMAAPPGGRFGNRYLLPSGIVSRASTCRLPCDRGKVADALEFIRTHAGGGLQVPDVVAVMGVSRRAAENHFRAATGRSIHEEIDEARFALVFDNLRNPKRSLGSIAGICGFPSESALRKAFRQRTGLSMRKWREQRLGA